MVAITSYPACVAAAIPNPLITYKRPKYTPAPKKKNRTIGESVPALGRSWYRANNNAEANTPIPNPMTLDCLNTLQTTE